MRQRSHRLLPALLLALSGAAIAQGTAPDLPNLGIPELLSHLGLVAVIAGAVDFIRNLRKGADGKPRMQEPLHIGALAVLIGAALGTLATRLPWFTWGPDDGIVQALGWPLSGIVLGAVCGIEAVFGVNLVKYWLKQRGQAAAPLAIVSGMLPSSVHPLVKVALDLARAALPNASATRWNLALEALGPVIAELAQSDAVLTPDVRATIQKQVLRALEKAGLVGRDLS